MHAVLQIIRRTFARKIDLPWHAVFLKDVGEAFDLADGGYGWVDVVSITPERQRPYRAK